MRQPDRSYLKKDVLFCSIVLLVHAVFFLMAWHYKKIYDGDSFEYIYAAVNLLEKGFFYSGNPAMPVEPEYLTFRTPVYPVMLAAVYFFTVNNWIVLAIQNLISVFNIILLRDTLLKTGYDRRYDWLLLLLLVTYPAQFIHANTIEPEILLQTFVLLYCRHVILLLRTGNRRHLWGMCITLILGLFVKPVLYPYTLIHLLGIPVVAAVLAVRQGASRSDGILRSLLPALIPLLCVMMYNGWNQHRTGKFHFTSNQSFNAVFYFYFYKSNREGIPEAKRFLAEERRIMADMPEFEDRYDYANRRGRELLSAHFFDYMKYHLGHSARFFIDPGKGNMDLFTGRLTYGRLYGETGTDFYSVVKEHGWWRGMLIYSKGNPMMLAVMIVFLFNLVKLAGMVCYIRTRRIPLLERLFVVLFLAYFALLTGPISSPRYVIPVSLVYIGAVVMGIQYFHKSKKESRRSAAMQAQLS